MDEFAEVLRAWRDRLSPDAPCRLMIAVCWACRNAEMPLCSRRIAAV